MDEKRPIERSTLEAYVGIAVALVAGLVPMSFWVELTLLLLLYAMAGDVILHSKYTMMRATPLKVLLFVIVPILIWLVFKTTLIQKYEAEHAWDTIVTAWLALLLVLQSPIAEAAAILIFGIFIGIYGKRIFMRIKSLFGEPDKGREYRVFISRRMELLLNIVALFFLVLVVTSILLDRYEASILCNELNVAERASANRFSLDAKWTRRCSLWSLPFNWR